MILNLDQLNALQRNVWRAFAKRLETMGYNLKVFSGSKEAAVINIESGAEIGRVTRDMIQDEEIDYILFSRLHLKR